MLLIVSLFLSNNNLTVPKISNIFNSKSHPHHPQLLQNQICLDLKNKNLERQIKFEMFFFCQILE